jgi:GTP diphosphokinase / guanosine-3',5'-bis(diphosphate) 3'-diphosphatase
MGTQIIKENRYIQEQFDELYSNCSQSMNQQDLALVVKAFKRAERMHYDVQRSSGEPFIIHPLSVAKIVHNEIGLGAEAVACALLHDVVEDTPSTIEDIKQEFGERIGLIIDGLTKISEVFGRKNSLQAENFRKILMTLSEDVRVIIIKLADRLHNMRTLDALPPNKQIKISGETIYFYAPLAHRLGLYRLKNELEDLSLMYRHPNKYQEIKDEVKNTSEKREEEIEEFLLPIKKKLEENRITYELVAKPKPIYSIWNIMQQHNLTFEEISNILNIRIVVYPTSFKSEKAQCWDVYSLLTDVYVPKPERIRDWISSPKSNGYEALHVTVMGPQGNWMEVQIRSKRMDDFAKKGFAARWKYKDQKERNNSLDLWLSKIKEHLEDPKPDTMEFLDEFRLNLFASEIFVFTPKGDAKTLPAQSTALDFAYDIHSEVGNKAIGAKVNHQLVPLSHELHNGDQVEILTSDNQKIQRDWLDHVQTAKAKVSITNAIKAETKNRTYKGKKELEKALNNIGLTPNSNLLRKLMEAYEVTSKEELYSKIGSGIITLEGIDKILRKHARNKFIRYWSLQLSRTAQKTMPRNKKNSYRPNVKEHFDYKSPYIIREKSNNNQLPYQIAKCCHPIPGDEVVGYKKPNSDTIIVHKAKCPNAIKLMSSQGQYIVPARWTTHTYLSFLTKMNLKGIDRNGLAKDITTVISNDLDASIRKLNFDTIDGMFEGYIELYVHNVSDLNNLILNLSKIKGIDSVKRIEDV